MFKTILFSSFITLSAFACDSIELEEGDDAFSESQDDVAFSSQLDHADADVIAALEAEQAEIEAAVAGGPPDCGELVTVNCNHSAFDGCRDECIEWRDNTCWYGYYCVPKPWYRSQSYCDGWKPIIKRSFNKLTQCMGGLAADDVAEFSSEL